MKHLVLIGALGVTGIVQATAATSLKLIETSVHSRVGFDSNPAGTSGTSAAVLKWIVEAIRESGECRSRHQRLVEAWPKQSQP